MICYDTLYQKADAYRNRVAERVTPVCSDAKNSFTALWNRIAPTLLEEVFSAERIFTILLLSFGIAVGAAFADFFRKHPGLIVFTIVASTGLFLFHALHMLDAEYTDNEF